MALRDYRATRGCYHVGDLVRNVQLKTKYGDYLVTPEDRELLDRDMMFYGTMFLVSYPDGTADRVDPSDVYLDLCKK